MEEFIKSREQLPRLCEFWFVILKVFAALLEASCSPAFPPLLMGPVDSGKVYCEGWELPSLPSPSPRPVASPAVLGFMVIEW